MRPAIVIAVVVFAIHMATNHQYGFHRDELQTLDDARHLDWGYVVYPPFTPLVARLALELFGPSPTGLRMFSALAQSLIIILAALMARDLGGGRWAQTLAAALTAIAPLAVLQGALFQYVAFDMLWWVVAAWLLIRMIRTGDPRHWIPIGAALGLGAMTRFSIAFFIAGLAAGVLLTPLRRHLRSRWLWIGAAISILIYVPNLIWQIRHDFVTLEFLASIHERDVRIGRTGGFLVEQLFVPASPFSIPWWIAGLWFVFRRREFRAIGLIFVATVALLVVMKGRSYYTGPLYPMLLAAGAVQTERFRRAPAVVGIIAGAVLSAAVMLPIAPVGSKWFRFVANVHDNFAEQIGWEELTDQVAVIYYRLAPEERARTAIYASNYGEAGAINLYGRGLGLPRAISGINSHWSRGYGPFEPQTVIVLGSSLERVSQRLTDCTVAGIVTNRWGIENEETGHPEIVVCRGSREPWPSLWKSVRSFG